jgi:hypothetical protein
VTRLTVAEARQGSLTPILALLRLNLKQERHVVLQIQCGTLLDGENFRKFCVDNHSFVRLKITGLQFCCVQRCFRQYFITLISVLCEVAE